LINQKRPDSQRNRVFSLSTTQNGDKREKEKLLKKRESKTSGRSWLNGSCEIELDESNCELEEVYKKIRLTTHKNMSLSSEVCIEYLQFRSFCEMESRDESSFAPLSYIFS